MLDQVFKKKFISRPTDAKWTLPVHRTSNARLQDWHLKRQLRRNRTKGGGPEESAFGGYEWLVFLKKNLRAGSRWLNAFPLGFPKTREKDLLPTPPTDEPPLGHPPSIRNSPQVPAP